MRRDGGVQVRRILWTWRVFILVCLSVCISGRTCHASEETGCATRETVSVSRSDKENSLGHSDPELWEEMQERLLEAFDFTEMDEGMEQILPGEKRTFRDVLDPLLSGELETAWEMAKQYLYDQFSLNSAVIKSSWSRCFCWRSRRRFFLILPVHCKINRYPGSAFTSYICC